MLLNKDWRSPSRLWKMGKLFLKIEFSGKYLFTKQTWRIPISERLFAQNEKSYTQGRGALCRLLCLYNVCAK